VFVSYSHDSPQHKDLVREFATLLRVELGIDAHLDQWYETDRRDWSLWAMDQLDQADFVLAVASPQFRARTEGHAAAHEGRGAQFEGGLLRNKLTEDQSTWVRRILPVVLPGGSVDDIPEFLFPYSATHYVVGELTADGVAELRRAMSRADRHPMPGLGEYVVPEPAGTNGSAGRTLKQYAAEVNQACEFIPGRFDEAATVLRGLSKLSLKDRSKLLTVIEEMHEAVSTACRLVNGIDPPVTRADQEKVDNWRQEYMRVRDTLGSAAHQLREEEGKINLLRVMYRIPTDITLYQAGRLLEIARRKAHLIGITNAIP
jgi:hypothetical protein